MDYSSYTKIEFRRKFFKLLGAAISIYDPNTNTLIGYIKMKAWSLRGDIRIYTDQTMQNEIVRIGGRQIISFQKVYDIYDSAGSKQIVSLRQKSLKSYFVRNHIDIIDNQGNPYGYVQETSSTLAIARRWFAVVPYIGPIVELVLAFVPQTFDIMYAPQNAQPQLTGKIIHKKNPFLVRLSLDTTMAQVKLDPKINIAVCSLISILDAVKNR